MRAQLLDPGQGRNVPVGADRMVVKGGDDAFTIVEYLAGGVGGPPLHVHHGNEEVFYVLEGEVDFSCDGVTRRLRAGGVALVPREAVHTFAVAGDGRARWVGLFSPGRYVKLVEELGELLAKGAPDPAAVAALFARYDTDIVGPPLA